MGITTEFKSLKSAGRFITKVQPKDLSKAGVYFSSAVGANLVKIGFVQNHERVDVRMDQLRSGCPFPIKVEFILTPATRNDEFSLHCRFKALQFYGEWFKCEGALKEFLQWSIVEPEEATRSMIASLRQF